MLESPRISGYNPRLSQFQRVGASDGSSLSGNGQGPNGGSPCVPRQQQDQAPVSAEPAAAAFLGRNREPVGEPAADQRRAAHDRQERHRRRPGGYARPRRARLGERRAQGDFATMREKIKVESSAGTGHFYTTSKNKKLMPEKMEIKKFDPVARKHVMYKETKLK